MKLQLPSHVLMQLVSRIPPAFVVPYWLFLHKFECAPCIAGIVLQVETIMISIISMLSSPNDESPANIDAAKDFREDYQSFKKKVRRAVRKSQEMC